MNSLLDVTRGTLFDDSIVKIESHTHLPYASSKFGPSDEIRIPFQQTDTYVWPAGSSLLIEGNFTEFKNFTLANNAGAHAFNSIRLELNGTEVDSTRLPGITTTLKGYASYSKAKVDRLSAAGWNITDDNNAVVDLKSGHFDICIPLNTLLGFLEDYSKILMNVRLELVLIRANRNENMLIPIKGVTITETTTLPELTIEKISWKLPYVFLNDREKLKMLGVLEKNIPLEIPFRSWSLHTYPTLPQTTNHSWTIKTSNQLEKPRYVIFALQTGRNSKLNTDASSFDACGLKGLQLHIGSQVYPYDSLNLDFEKRSLSWLYEMYVNFQTTYYSKEDVGEPALKYDEFINKAPLVIIDCSHQVESATGSTVDIRLEIETREDMPPETSAHCLIIHDQLVTYYPLSGIVSKGV